jgi:hypothetical protein
MASPARIGRLMSFTKDFVAFEVSKPFDHGGSVCQHDPARGVSPR